MHNYQGFAGVKFVAGRTFQTEYGTHEAGHEVKEARALPNLDVLVSAGFLYPFYPEDDYNYLPPHLFTATNTYEEVVAKLRGDQDSMDGQTPQFPEGKPDVVKEAETQAEVQAATYPLILAAARENQIRAVEEAEEQRRVEGTPERSQAKSRSSLSKKPAAKKAAGPNQKGASNG